MSLKSTLKISLFSLILVYTAQTHAAEERTLIIKDHKFAPETFEIPAGEKIKITVKNQDSTPEEFESYELNREKVIQGNGEGIIFIGPLEAGTYPFFGDFHQESAKGKIIVK